MFRSAPALAQVAPPTPSCDVSNGFLANLKPTDQEKARLREIDLARKRQGNVLSALGQELRLREVTNLLSPGDSGTLRVGEDVAVEDLMEDESISSTEKMLVSERLAVTPKELQEAKAADRAAEALCAKNFARHVAPREPIPTSGSMKPDDDACQDAENIEYGANLDGGQLERITAIRKELDVRRKNARLRLKSLDREAYAAAHRTGDQDAAIREILERRRDVVHTMDVTAAESVQSERRVFEPEQVGSARGAHEDAVRKCHAQERDMMLGGLAYPEPWGPKGWAQDLPQAIG